MATPHSLRLAKQGDLLTQACGRTGLKQPDLVKLALAELFSRYPSDVALMKAVITFRSTERKAKA